MYVSCREVIEKQLYDVIGKAHTYMYVSCREVIEKQLYDVVGKRTLHTCTYPVERL